MVDKLRVVCYYVKWRNNMRLSIKTSTPGLSRANKRLEENFDWSVDHLLPLIALAILLVALVVAMFVN